MARNLWLSMLDQINGARMMIHWRLIWNFPFKTTSLGSVHCITLTRWTSLGRPTQSFSYAPNGFDLLAPVWIDFSLASLYMSTLKWHGTIVVCTLACSSHCFLSPLCTWVCVFVYTSKWYHTCLINTLLAINILHILYTRHRTCFMLCSALYMLGRGGSYNCVVTLCEFSASLKRLHVRGGASTNIVTLYRVIM